MRRREFIAIVGAIAAWPTSVRTQQATATRRAGVLMGAKTLGLNIPQLLLAAADELME
jgi:hypothetical protein